MSELVGTSIRRGLRLDAVVATGAGPGATCPPSILPLRRLPGYARRGGARPIFRIDVPTCAATRTGTIEIPAGPFVFGGPGEPPMATLDFGAPPAERTLVLHRADPAPGPAHARRQLVRHHRRALYPALENARSPRLRTFYNGARCAVTAP